MSQIPRSGRTPSGGQIKATSSKTTTAPGNKTVTVTKTVVTQVVPCIRAAGTPGARTPGSGIGRPSGAGTPGGLRAPSTPTGIRAPSTPTGIRPPSGASGIRPPGGSTPRPSGLRPPGTPGRSLTPQTSSCAAVRSAAAAATPSRIQSPAARGLPQPRPSGLPPVKLTTPKGSQRTLAGTPTASQRSIGRPSALQSPRVSALRAPTGRPSPLVTAKSVSVEQQVQKQLAIKAKIQPDGKVIAKSAKAVSPVEPETIDTPEGPQPIIKQTVLEQRVERDERGEKVIKNLGITGVDPATGVARRIAMGIQQFDPNHPRDVGKEVISITSTVSLTATYSTVSQETSRAVTEPLSEAADLTAADIAKMVEEEKEDVENTLKMLPPDLALIPGRHEMKQRLQQLRLNSESVALLEQSIIHPEPTADEAQAEPTPEAMAAMMHTVEKGVPPQSTPDQVFNSLFTETSNEKYIRLSPASQGPLQDVVVPTELPKEVHQEVVSETMEKLTEKLSNIADSEEIPYVDIFTRVMDDEKKSPKKGKNKEKNFRPITDEKSLWVNSNLEHLVNIIGAEPVEILDPLDINNLGEEANLEDELANGMEYYVSADPVQYMSRVQLRGTQPPSYFPGYIIALPDFAEIVKLAKSPDEVFASAWKSVQPKYFADESTQSISF